MLVLPGHKVDKNAQHGPGIYVPPTDPPCASLCGTLSRAEKRTPIVYVETNSKRYIPTVKDPVVGICVAKHSETLRVSLQEYSPSVQLSLFAFENATKKNRPTVNVGSLVYGRVVSADKDMDAEIECVDPSTGKSAGFGELKEGTLVHVSLGYARHLLYDSSPLLSLIGQLVPFEIAIGVNGRIWLNAQDVLALHKVAKCVKEGEFWPQDQLQKNVAALLGGR